MSTAPLRVVVADDERPARQFLVDLLARFPGVHLVGEATSGDEAVALIEAERPQLALLDLQMPTFSGLDVVRRVRRDALPFVAFVTAFDDFAIEAFELNAVDYLLKPVEHHRLGMTLDRVQERLKQPEPLDTRAATLARAAVEYERMVNQPYLERLPVRAREEVVLLPVKHIAYVIADGELLHITTTANERHIITYRLHALESRLDPKRFVRLSRGTLANLDLITKLSPMPGGTYVARLSTGKELPVSRLQSRVLRETLMKL